MLTYFSTSGTLCLQLLFKLSNASLRDTTTVQSVNAAAFAHIKLFLHGSVTDYNTLFTRKSTMYVSLQ